MKGYTLGILLSSLVQKIKITKEGTLWRYQKVSEKSLTKPKKQYRQKCHMSCQVTTKSSKAMIANGGTLFKHPRLLFSKTGRPGETL